MMRKILFSLLTMAIVSSACASDNWRSKVGLPQDCTNPIFTMPSRMNPAGRVRGAGINMNDGEAYTSRYVGFSSEWHYAPKLSLCQQEKAAMPQVMGLFFDEHLTPQLQEPLKFCVRVHHGCGAVVVYRAFNNYRYTNVQSDNLEQFIAVYDEDARLTDAMMMGYDGDLTQILSIEPHKQYTPPVNMGSHDMQFDETGEHFTIRRYTYLKDHGEGVPEMVEMMRYYTITPEGKIRLDKVTNNSENHSKKNDKPGAPIEEVASPAAVDMLEMMLTPMSDPQMLPRLDKCCAALLNNEAVGERLMHLGMMVYNRDPKAFLEYAYENRAKTSLLQLLKRAMAYKGTGAQYDMCLAHTIENCSPSKAAQQWLMKKLK